MRDARCHVGGVYDGPIAAVEAADCLKQKADVGEPLLMLPLYKAVVNVRDCLKCPSFTNYKRAEVFAHGLTSIVKQYRIVEYLEGMDLSEFPEALDKDIANIQRALEVKTHQPHHSVYLGGRVFVEPFLECDINHDMLPQKTGEDMLETSAACLASLRRIYPDQGLVRVFDRVMIRVVPIDPVAVGTHILFSHDVSAADFATAYTAKKQGVPLDVVKNSLWGATTYWTLTPAAIGFAF